MLYVGIFTNLSRFCVGRCCRPYLCSRMKRNTPFHSHHAVKFGMRICERSTGASTTVVTAVCRFYDVLRKEE